MELKSREELPPPRRWLVLIVPLWNWNIEVEPFAEVGASFNRTFMELKCQKWQEEYCYTDGF